MQAKTRYMHFWENHGWQWWDGLPALVRQIYIKNLITIEQVHLSAGELFQRLGTLFRSAHHVEMMDAAAPTPDSDMDLDPESELSDNE